MITIEEATRSLDIMTGLFIIGAAFAVIFTYVYAWHIRMKAKNAVSEKCEAEKQRMEAAYKADKRKLQTQHFVSNYEAKERIKALEKQLMQAEYDLKLERAKYERLQMIMEKAHEQR